MDLSDKYVIWFDKPVPRTYSVNDIGDLEGIESYELKRGAKLASRWPGDASCEVIDGDPKNPAFADNLLNTSRQLIISERLKNALQELKVADVEYLPIKLIEDGKVFDVQFFIAHLLNLPDCLDLE